MPAGLGLRYAFLGALETSYLNANGIFLVLFIRKQIITASHWWKMKNKTIVTIPRIFANMLGSILFPVYLSIN